MRHPDVLDRRALALLELVDPFGRPIAGPVRIAGDGLRTIAKTEARVAVLDARGLGSHSAAFATPPAQPAIGSVKLVLDLRPADEGLAPRRFTLPLPRDPDPERKGEAASLFRGVPVTFLPSPLCRVPPTAAAAYVTVRKKNDGRRVAGALVRLKTDNGQFEAMAVTDAAGEALVIVPQFPLSFTGSGGVVEDGLSAKVTAAGKPAQVRLVGDGAVSQARDTARRQTGGFANPDELAALAAPLQGAVVRLSLHTIGVAQIEWGG